MFSTVMYCRQVCQCIYEQFIIWTVFQTGGHMYVKVVIITCQEKFPAAHSLEKIQGSVAAFSNCTRSLYLMNDYRHSCKTHRKPRTHKGLLYPRLINLLLTVQTFGYKYAFMSTELHQSCLGCIQWNQPDLHPPCYWGSLLITGMQGKLISLPILLYRGLCWGYFSRLQDVNNVGQAWMVYREEAQTQR